MATIKVDKETKNSVKIGSFCILTYLVSYVARNITGVVTPMMVAQGDYTKSYLGMLTTIYFAIYATAALLNAFFASFDNWNGVIISWTGMMIVGLGGAFVAGLLIKGKKEE